MDIEDQNHHLLQPLIDPSALSAASTPPEDSGIIFRISLVVLIGIMSIWANYEASKGFAITIVNEAGHTFPGQKFQLFYVSNDEATRMLIRASKIVENFLYPDNGYTKKPVKHIIVKLADQKLDDQVFVDSRVDHEFVLNLSPSIMEGTNFGRAMFLAMQEGVARVWLWDGQGQAPKILINGIMEYITNYSLSDSGSASNSDAADESPELASAAACWKLEDSRAVAEFLNYCERRRPGFIRRLNQAMKDGWHDGELDVALGLPVENLCTTYEALRYNFSSV